jgi:Flp pilus assembly protein TadG
MLRRLLGCKRGVGAVEFAIAAPVTFMFILGMADVSMVLFVDTLLEGGLRQASRLGVTGYAPTGVTREQAIKQVVVDTGMGFVDASKIKIETKAYSSFGAITAGESFTDDDGNGQYDDGEPFEDTNGNGWFDGDPGVPGAGGAGDVVFYRVSYDWPVMAGFIAPLLGGADGKVSLNASIAVRNEPF